MSDAPVRRILGIETSCDETSAAVVSGTPEAMTLESLVILSQDVHRLFGGVVPEIASRQHLMGIVPAVEGALRDAGVSLDGVDAIAVTHAPGLVGALLVGTSYAKTLALSHGLPVVPVHHLEGHLFATLLEHPEAKPPFTALLVSGGHTLLLDVPEWGHYRLLGQTRDDAVGEAFDKVAKLLGLPYPGGRPIEQLAATVESPAHGSAHWFARPMLRKRAVVTDEDYYDCSFSGLKTAVLYAVRAAEKAGTIEWDRPHIAKGFQDAVIDTLVEKVYRAAKAHRRGRVVLGGGVACNQALQQAMRERFAAAGLFRLERAEFAAPEMTATASLPLPGMF